MLRPWISIKAVEEVVAMATNEGSEVGMEVDAMHGLEAVEDIESSGSDSRLPFDPREKGPMEVLHDIRRWMRDRWYIVLAAVLVVYGAEYLFGIPRPSLPEWYDVAVVAGGIAAGAGVLVGLKVGRFFATPDYRVLSQLDAKSGDQDLLKISMERWRDMTVVDHEGDHRGRAYLTEVVINGHPAVECDRYYPSINTAIGSWQAGASNADLREYKRKVDIVKTDLEKEANQAIEAKVNADERARQQAKQTNNYLLAVVEGVLEPGSSTLSERLEQLQERDDSESHEDLLTGLEQDLFTSGNGHDADADGVESADGDRLEEIQDRARELVVSLDPRGPKGGDGDA